MEGAGASENLGRDLENFRGAGLILRPLTGHGALTKLKGASNLRVYQGMTETARVHSASPWSIYYTRDIFIYHHLYVFMRSQEILATLVSMWEHITWVRKPPSSLFKIDIH